MIGLHKRVFKIGSYVIKTPRNFYDIGDILSEQWCYMFCGKKLRKLLCPTFFIPLIPINVQPYIKICDYDENFNKIAKKYKRLLETQISFKTNIFGDIKPRNFGVYKGTTVKIDFGSTVWWYNLKIDIFGFQENNIEMNLWECIKNSLTNNK